MATSLGITLGSLALGFPLATPAFGEESVPVQPEVLPELTPAEKSIRALRSIRESDLECSDPLGELTALVSETADLLVEFLHERRVGAFAERSSQIMSVYQHALLLDALEAAPATFSREAAARLLERAPGPVATSVAIEVLGATGTAVGLEQIHAHVAALPSEEFEGRVADAVQQAVESLLRRDPKTYGELMSQWRNWPTELWTALVLAVGERGDPAGLPFLGQVMAWDRDLRLACLAQVRLVGASGDPFVDMPVILTVRELIAVEDARLRKAGLLALGDLGDLESVPTLIELLDNEDRGTRENALWALRRMTGIGLNDQAHTWRVWFARESDWYERSADVFGRLGSGHAHEVLAAVNEISRHYLHREELARRVAEVLDHDEPSVRSAACLALARLGSRVHEEALAERLEDEDAQVRDAARASLVRLVGADQISERSDLVASSG